MQKKDFHMRFRDAAPLSLLFAAFEKSFPLFLRPGDQNHVDDGGKGRQKKVLQTIKAFSTGFPQQPVDIEGQ
jgi:hypothetical protein